MLSNRQITLGTPSGTVVSLASVVKPYLNISGTSEDTLLNLWIGSAISQIEGYCKRFFLERTVVEKMFGEIDTRQLVLTHRPVTTFTSVLDVDGVVVDSTTYTVDKLSGVVTRVDSGVIWNGDLTANYSSGWASANMPEAIQIAVCELVKLARADKNKSNPDVVILQSPDVGQITYRGAVRGAVPTNLGPLDDLPANVKRALMPYRRVWI